jgi:hypothetical protein
MSEHTFEPELDQPTPRRVAARDGCTYGCGLWVGRLFLLPHTLAGLFILYQALRATVLYLGVLLAGTDVEGHITAKTEHPHRKGAYYTADYAFTVDGDAYAAQMPINADEYAALRVGQTIPVRAWDAAPHAAHWVDAAASSPLKPVGAAWFGALLWNGFMSVVVWFLYVVPWRRRQLVRYGVPTAGVVRAIVYCKDGKADARRIEYEYTPGPSELFRDRLSGSVKITPQRAAEVKVGNVLTVLYDPRRPKRSVLYKFSDYKARSAMASRAASAAG